MLAITYIYVYICSGGIKVTFLGTGLDVQFVLIIDIVDDYTANGTILVTPYNIVSMYFQKLMYNCIDQCMYVAVEDIEPPTLKHRVESLLQ